LWDSWPLAAIVKLIPVPETPFLDYFRLKKSRENILQVTDYVCLGSQYIQVVSFFDDEILVSAFTNLVCRLSLLNKYISGRKPEWLFNVCFWQNTGQNRTEKAENTGQNRNEEQNQHVEMT
jgi:hypothetical protein